MSAELVSPSRLSVAQTMRLVALALVPGMLVMAWIYGIGVLLNVGLAVAVALLMEWLCLLVRNRPVKPFLSDWSAIVTALLLALCLPPLLPAWVVMIGVFFSIVVAKHLYGGLGYNPFNPAMVGYAVLIVSFPLQLSQWPAADAIDGLYAGAAGFGGEVSIATAINNALSVMAGAQPDWDAFTAATPLDAARTLRLNNTVGDVAEVSVLGSPVVMLSLAYLLGGLYLVHRRIISWHIPLSMLLSVLIFGGLFAWLSAGTALPPLLHLLGGATILGAFFIATDPVSAATTTAGKLCFGALIGLLLVIIRNWGAYPDAVAFAVLIMNMAVPVLDYLSRPTPFGQQR